MTEYTRYPVRVSWPPGWIWTGSTAELARWFDDHVPALERRRTYACASRRQSATPDIPRPGRHLPPELQEGRTFGAVLDTSGSMAMAMHSALRRSGRKRLGLDQQLGMMKESLTRPHHDPRTS